MSALCQETLSLSRAKPSDTSLYSLESKLQGLVELVALVVFESDKVALFNKRKNSLDALVAVESDNVASLRSRKK